jgi:hypothetical protein
MHPLSPALFIAGASTLVGPPERAELTALRRELDRAGNPLATAVFVGHVGYWAHYDEVAAISAWPFPLGADCDTLADLAAVEGVLSIGQPDPGAIYLAWSRREKRFARAGIIVNGTAPPGEPQPDWSYDCLVLEGCAVARPVAPNEDRYEETGPIETVVQWARRTRVTCSPSAGDRFVSWMDLDERGPTTRVSRPERKAA